MFKYPVRIKELLLRKSALRPIFDRHFNDGHFTDRDQYKICNIWENKFGLNFINIGSGINPVILEGNKS